MRSLLFFFLMSFCALWGEEQKLIVMRHGQAFNNVNRVHNSSPQNLNYRPVGLTEKGKKQVEKTARELLTKGFNNNTIAAVFVSPLPRCVQTAQTLVQQGVIAEGKLIIDNRLRERNAGDLEGKPHSNRTAGVGWETNEEVKERTENFYHSILSRYPEGNVLVVTHGIVAADLINLTTHKVMRLTTGEAVIVPLRGDQ